MDVLYTKWWMTAILRPMEYGLLGMCATDKVFSQCTLFIMRTLRAIFCRIAESEKLKFSPSVLRYVKSKEYFFPAQK